MDLTQPQATPYLNNQRPSPTQALIGRRFQSLSACEAALKAAVESESFRMAVKSKKPSATAPNRVIWRCRRGCRNRYSPDPNVPFSKRRKPHSQSTNCPWKMAAKLHDGVAWVPEWVGDSFEEHNHAIELVDESGSSSGGPQRLMFEAVPIGVVRHPVSVEYGDIFTPAACYVDFCLIPVGTGNVSVAAEIAEVQRVLMASGLKYTMHSAGTTVEGGWDEVMAAVGKAHAVVHGKGVVRVQSSMRVGTRTDKTQTAEDKVSRVEALLSAS